MTKCWRGALTKSWWWTLIKLRRLTLVKLWRRTLIKSLSWHSWRWPLIKSHRILWCLLSHLIIKLHLVLLSFLPQDFLKSWIILCVTNIKGLLYLWPWWNLSRRQLLLVGYLFLELHRVLSLAFLDKLFLILNIQLRVLEKLISF